MVHEFTGFTISVSKTIAYHWPLLLERANVQTSRTRLETQGFLFWKLGNIIFCISTPERLVRLGLAQVDFNKMSLTTGKKPDKATTFPTAMDLAEGLEILGIAIKKRYPSQSSPTVVTASLAQRAPTPTYATAILMPMQTGTALPHEGNVMEKGTTVEEGEVEEGTNPSAETPELSTTTTTGESDRSSIPPIMIPRVRQTISPQLEITNIKDNHDPSRNPNEMTEKKGDNPSEWGSGFKITPVYTAPINMGLRPGSTGGVEGRSKPSPTALGLPPPITPSVVGLYRNPRRISPLTWTYQISPTRIPPLETYHPPPSHKRLPNGPH